jgi:hypothetical protein
VIVFEFDHEAHATALHRDLSLALNNA